MRRFYVVGFSILLAFDTLAQLGFKLAAEAAAPPGLDVAWLLRIVMGKWIYLAVAGYLGAGAAWMTLLRRAPVGPAFATTHLDIVAVLLVSVAFLGERLSAPQVAGAALILTGVWILASAKPPEPD